MARHRHGRSLGIRSSRRNIRQGQAGRWTHCPRKKLRQLRTKPRQSLGRHPRDQPATPARSRRIPHTHHQLACVRRGPIWILTTVVDQVQRRDANRVLTSRCRKPQLRTSLTRRFLRAALPCNQTRSQHSSCCQQATPSRRNGLRTHQDFSLRCYSWSNEPRSDRSRAAGMDASCGRRRCCEE
jgi:hypothetical protein